MSSRQIKLDHANFPRGSTSISAVYICIKHVGLTLFVVLCGWCCLAKSLEKSALLVAVPLCLDCWAMPKDTNTKYHKPHRDRQTQYRCGCVFKKFIVLSALDSNFPSPSSLTIITIIIRSGWPYCLAAAAPSPNSCDGQPLGDRRRHEGSRRGTTLAICLSDPQICGCGRGCWLPGPPLRRGLI